MYLKNGNQWTYATKVVSNTRRKKFRCGNLSPSLPIDATPVTVVGHDYIYVTGSPMISPNSESEARNSLHDFLKSRRQEDQWAVQQLFTSDDGMHIQQAISQGSAVAASDGSYKQGFGTSAFLLRDSLEEDQHPIYGVNWVRGNVEDQSSHRSELAGIAGVIAICHALSL